MGAPVTYDPATVDMSDYPEAGLSYDDAYIQTLHNNKIVLGKELAQIQAANNLTRRQGRIAIAGTPGLVGMGALNGLQRRSGLNTQVISKTTSYQLRAEDYGTLLLMNPSTTGQVAILPNPRTVPPGWYVTVKKINSSTTNTVGVQRKNSFETIDGRSADELLTAQNSYVTLMTDGANWLVLGADDWVSNAISTNTNFTAATTAWGNAVSVNCGPGDWMLSAGFDLRQAGATITQILYAVSAFSGATTTDHVNGSNQFSTATFPGGNNHSVAIALWRPRDTELAVASTYYAKLNGSFTGGPPQFYCYLLARRMR